MTRSEPTTDLTSLPDTPIVCTAEDTLLQLGPPVADATLFAAPHISGELGRLGKYRIQRELGRGGMGAVFLALDERLQRRVALKVMLPEAAVDDIAKERFLREARAAAQVASDHVVSIYEAEEINSIPYISLQFLEGCPLNDYTQKYGNPPLPEIVRIGQETATGLEAAHQLELVHRDIKPANLWLEAPRGRVKILDFGLARDRNENCLLTQKGHVMGTPAYMSPEQARGRALDGRSDLFSLGVVLYQLCTGQLPFQGDSVMAQLTALSVDEPTPVRVLNPRIPEALASLIHRLLAKQPADRPATGKAVADELKAIFDTVLAPNATGQPQVICVPMAISVHDTNPFEDMTQIVVSLSGEIAREAVPTPPNRSVPITRVAVLAFVVAVAAFLGIYNHQRGNVERAGTDAETPDPVRLTPAQAHLQPEAVKAALRESKSPKAISVSKDSDRLAAEYVLSVGGVVKINNEEADLTSVNELPNTPFLLTLANVVGNARVTDAGLASFKGCRNLVYLNLDGTRITNTGVASFKDCPTVRYLNLSNTQVGDEGLANFKDCKQLRRLDLANLRITDAGLAHFADCLDLRELYLQQSTIGSEGLGHFKNSPHLSRIRLDETSFGDVGVNNLLDKAELATLDLRSTPVTATGLDLLKTTLPQCRVTSTGSVFGPPK